MTQPTHCTAVIEPPQPAGLPEPAASDHGRDARATEAADDLVQRLREGQVSPEGLSNEQRVEWVDLLTTQGYSSSEIAALLRIGERTVRRDRAAIRREGALTPHLALGDEMLGEYQRFTLGAMRRLAKLCRDPSAKPEVRLKSEEVCSRVYQRFIETARRMEYIEGGGRRLRYQRETSAEEQKRELLRRASEAALYDRDPDPQIQRALARIEKKAKKAAVAGEV